MRKQNNHLSTGPNFKHFIMQLDNWTYINLGILSKSSTHQV